MTTPKFNLVAREADTLIRYSRNARTHGEAQIAQIAASIKEFGFTNPVLIDEGNTIIAGEGRVLAAKKLKLTAVPCLVLVGLSEAQKAAYALADNKIALNSGWDMDVLRTEIKSLSNLDLDMNLTGFSHVEIMALFDKAETAIAGLEPANKSLPDCEQDEQIGVVAGTEQVQVAEPEPAPQVDWSGMPDFHQPSDKPFRTLTVHFNDQAAVDAFAKLVYPGLTDKTKYLWYPQQVKVATLKIVYA